MDCSKLESVRQESQTLVASRPAHFKMRPGPFLLAALFRMFCVSPSARAFSIVPFPVLHPGGGSSRALRQSLLWRDGNIAVWRRLPLEIGRADFLGLQQDSEVHTFQPVEVRGEGGQEGFRVLPPDLWPHGSDPCKVYTAIFPFHPLLHEEFLPLEYGSLAGPFLAIAR